MKKKIIVFYNLLFLIIFLTACVDEEPPITGCVDPYAINYNPQATNPDMSSCKYRATLSFFVTCPQTSLPVKIWVDDVYQGQITTKLFYTPSGCWADGSLTVVFERNRLVFDYKAQHNDGTVYEGTAVVPANGCYRIEL